MKEPSQYRSNSPRSLEAFVRQRPLSSGIGRLASDASRSSCAGLWRRSCLKLRSLAPLLIVSCLLLSSVMAKPAGDAPLSSRSATPPRLSPDYTGVTLPPNIAPLNFLIEEPGIRYQVEIRSKAGDPIRISSRSPCIQIPPAPWKDLLMANRGQPLYVDVSVERAQSGWERFATITNQVAQEQIDSWLAYRLLKPLFNTYRHVGIYQRNLESFEQRPILQNDKFNHGCLNCHTPLNRRPDTFCFNIRAVSGANHNPMMLVISNKVIRVNRTMGYLAWHPSGRLLTFSINQLSLFYHTRGNTRDVFDAHSDLGIYRVDSNTVVFPPPISSPDRNETWPAWSADGRYLYFSSAFALPEDKFRHIRYDLMRVSYDISKDKWGQPELMVSSEQTGLSACQPKVSPDGRWLLFTMCEYGNFPIYRSSSDLYVMDLRTKKYRRLSINSDRDDSWHTWSGNSRWIVFSSKRIDGLFARPFISYVDAQGQFQKPFVLPQEDPTFYDSCLNTFNVPELMDGPVTVSQEQLANEILRPRNVLTPSGPPRPLSATPHAGGEGSDNQEQIRE